MRHAVSSRCVLLLLLLQLDQQSSGVKLLLVSQQRRDQVSQSGFDASLVSTEQSRYMGLALVVILCPTLVALKQSVFVSMHSPPFSFPCINGCLFVIRP